MYNQELDISSGKFEEVADRLHSVHEAKHKILVFSQFTRHLNLFKEHLDKKKLKYSMLTGSTTKRREAVEAFTENDDCNIFLISLKAGGVGLNLTKADYVFVLDPWWNPFAEKQAIDRAYRIGQKSHVFSYKFITKNTIEEKILQLQKRKKTLATDFIPEGGKATLDLDQEDLKELFE
jgi:SNF2 family DNA or RNA helicase